MEPLLPLPPSDATVVNVKRSVGLQLLISLFAGAAAGTAGMALGQRMAAESMRGAISASPSLWASAPLVLLAFFLVLLAHELGHIVGGLSQGFRFRLLVLGPFRLERDFESGRLRWSLNRSLELAGGIAACMPVDDHDLVRRTRVMVAAGPLTSLVLGALAWTVIVTSPIAWWTFSVGVLGACSLMIALVTAIPMNNGSFVSDGKRFLQLRNDSPTARRDVAQLVLTLGDQLGTPIANQPVTKVRDSLEPADGSMQELVARFNAYAWLVAHDRVDEGRVQLLRALVLAKGKPFHLESLIAAEQAFVLAHYDRDATGAETVVHPHHKSWGQLPESSRTRTEAAIALARGDTDTARRLIARTRTLTLNTTAKPSGSALWTLDRLAEMEQRLSA